MLDSLHSPVCFCGRGEVGLIVDTNVRRVCCRLGWAPEGSSADQVRHELESWLPKDLWAEASFLLVGFGQQVTVALQALPVGIVQY